MVRPPPKFDQIFDPGCLCLEAGTQILDFKWLQGFFLVGFTWRGSGKSELHRC